ncbi:DUF4136 domain-containing protein [Spirosoma sp. RP8]|uniref:DUF4136 domain-containing protein n=1 Tax=Spirosoma liriopis TaxID=2937440 RepID=A0ABT0HGB0_9BACT|nr:DUF4136 domain-containing protein [Spirosoma liriopis]MCK8491201.1 DUF4136 domain-containing protein [Spirosoma liriopis]
MKRLFFIALLGLATSLTQAQNVTVNSETKPNTDFSRYKSYVWASQVDRKLDPGYYFLNDLVLKKQIREAVGFAMDGRGYKFNRQAPDLIVNFRVFDKPTTIKGYTSAGSDYFSSNEVQALGDEQDIKVEAGTILINLIDTKTDQAVWQGLASGLTSNNGFDRQQGKIREAINLIFNKYPYRADKF